MKNKGVYEMFKPRPHCVFTSVRDADENIQVIYWNFQSKNIEAR